MANTTAMLANPLRWNDQRRTRCRDAGGRSLSLAHGSLSKSASQLSGHYDKTLEATRGSRVCNWGSLVKTCRVRSINTVSGLACVFDIPTATRMSIAPQLQEQIVGAYIALQKPVYARCWIFGESIQNGKGMMRRASIRVPNLPSSKF